MIAGHRRRHASELAGFNTIPAIVRNLSDDEATIVMVDSNLQRDKLLPSEKAFAYRMKLEAICRQGQRRDLTSQPSGERLEASDKVGKEFGDCGRQVQRYIRLTYLVPEILKMVDCKEMAFRPAVEISYL